MCMAHINYPAKVLFKSANPVVTMIFGLVWFGKKYALRDYIVVLLLVLGLYFFMNGSSSENAPKGTGYGIFLVTLSMFGSAGEENEIFLVFFPCFLLFNLLFIYLIIRFFIYLFANLFIYLFITFLLILHASFFVT